MQTFTVHVPATSANLGPGFDCLGMALDLEHTLTVRPSAQLEIAIEGEGAGTLPADATNLVYQAMTRVASAVGQELPPLRLECRNAIPLARGLGSSAAAVVAGLVAGNHVLGGHLTQDEILALASEIEGHPDNVAPALLGGCVVVACEGGTIHWARLPVPADVEALLFIPDIPMPTNEARAVLPTSLSREDAVFNIGRATLLAAAFATGRLELIQVGMQDRLHQPPRSKIFPALPHLIASAVNAGAFGACLSGAGSTVLVLVDGEHVKPVMSTLSAEAERQGLSGRLRRARPVLSGATITT